ncbi:MAG: hypothetical protein QXO93_02130 [Acidilobaceae archaeon]
MSLAAKVLEEIEKNAELRKRFFKVFIAELMLEPDLRMAIVHAIMREVVSKSDLAEFEKKITGLITTVESNVKEQLSNIIANMVYKDDLANIDLRIRGLSNEVKEFRGQVENIPSLSSRFNDTITIIHDALNSFMTNVKDSIARIDSFIMGLDNKVKSVNNNLSFLSKVVYLTLIIVLILLLLQVLSILRII